MGTTRFIQSLSNAAIGVATGATLILTGLASAKAEVARPPQYILISFDGSYTNDMWKATREHGVANNARYTHFISGVDFLIGSSSRSIPGETKHIYTPPRFSGSRSNIGFGGDRAMLEERIRQVTKSIEAGMEIGGHANGHFDGTTWSHDEWSYEFNLFHDYLWNVARINSIMPSPLLPTVERWKQLMATQHIGFRAPFLGRGEGLWRTLGQQGWTIDGVQTNHRYRYDASQVTSELSRWPTRNSHGFWNFPLVSIPVPGRGQTILSMDYNFYFAQSNARDDLSRAPLYEEQMYQAYIGWFSRNYHGNRAPLNIGHHFSTWNGGAYWRALQRFVESVCTQPEVQCVTYKTMVDVLDGGLARDIPELSSGRFSQANRPRVSIPLLGRVSDDAKDATVPALVRNGRIARSPGAGFIWKVGTTPLRSANIDLVQLAKSGVSYITLERRGQRVAGNVSANFYIDWNTSDDTVRLRRLTQGNNEACPTGSHEEDVNVNYIDEDTISI